MFSMNRSPIRRASMQSLSIGPSSGRPLIQITEALRLIREVFRDECQSPNWRNITRLWENSQCQNWRMSASNLDICFPKISCCCWSNKVGGGPWKIWLRPNMRICSKEEKDPRNSGQRTTTQPMIEAAKVSIAVHYSSRSISVSLTFCIFSKCNASIACCIWNCINFIKIYYRQ